MSDYPHAPAAFINAIAEEGTKDEAVMWLQKQWNENCALRVALRKIAAIEDKLFGGDWDEINEARDIAIAALNNTEYSP